MVSIAVKCRLIGVFTRDWAEGRIEGWNRGFFYFKRSGFISIWLLFFISSDCMDPGVFWEWFLRKKQAHRCSFRRKGTDFEFRHMPGSEISRFPRSRLKRKPFFTERFRLLPASPIPSRFSDPVSLLFFRRIIRMTWKKGRKKIFGNAFCPMRLQKHFRFAFAARRHQDKKGGFLHGNSKPAFYLSG